MSRAGSRVQTNEKEPEKLAGPPPLPWLSLSLTGWPAEGPAPRGLRSRTAGLRAGAAQGKDAGPPSGATPPGLLPSPAWGALPGPRDGLARSGAGSLVPPPSPEPAVTAGPRQSWERRRELPPPAVSSGTKALLDLTPDSREKEKDF